MGAATEGRSEGIQPDAHEQERESSSAAGWPKISIVMPSMNQARFIEKSILSVLGQNYPHLELIVVDGGSTDGTLDLLDRFKDRFHYFESRKDRGQSHALNKGFQKASGELLGWLNSDDILTPRALEKVATKFMQSDQTTLGAIVGNGDIIDEHGSKYFAPPLPKVSFKTLLEWNNGTNFMQPSCYFTRQAWQSCGPLDESLHYCMDLDLWLKISQEFLFVTIPDVLSHSLTHSEAKTREHAEHSLMEQSIVMIRHGQEELALRNLYQLADRYSEIRKRYEEILETRYDVDELLELRTKLSRIHNTATFKIYQALASIFRKLFL